MGGEGGTLQHIGYPEWTKQRVFLAAHKEYTVSEKNVEKMFFLALSAGCLNSPNFHYSYGKSSLNVSITNHLAELGVPGDAISGDFIVSWDAVANLRLFIEGLAKAKEIAMEDKSELEREALKKAARLIK